MVFLKIDQKSEEKQFMCQMRFQMDRNYMMYQKLSFLFEDFVLYVC